MQSNILMYLTAMSVVSIHNLLDNIKEVTRTNDLFELITMDTNWTMEDDLAKIFPTCNGTRQSPINIATKEVKENLNLRLGITAYDKPISGLLTNRFPTFQLVPLSLKSPKPSAFISTSNARSFNPSQDSHFILNYIQFYWSHDGNQSVHLIDGKGSPLEIHLVHTNAAYESLEESSAKQDGVLIFSVSVVPSTHESYIFDKLLDGLSHISNHGNQKLVEEDSTWRSLLPVDTSKFYLYRGSMIFPPCREPVQWIVFEDKLRLGQKQLRRLKRYKFVSRNSRDGRQVDWSAQRRPMQPLHGRVVERSFSLRKDGGRASYSRV